MKPSPTNPYSLTDRELEVLAGLADGATNKEIAEDLNLSAGTINWYTKQIYRKLGVNSRTQASLLAKEASFWQSDEQAHVESDLPVYATDFIGREQEIRYIEKLLHESNARLITIVGHGGIGKTRLAVEIGKKQQDEFEDGIRFISLIDNRQPYDNLRSILHRRLNIDEINEDDYATLTNNRKLIILDNFDPHDHDLHELTLLIQSTNHLKIIVTSQVSLRLNQEYLIRLDGLNHTKDNNEASKFFEICVRRFQPDFSLPDHSDCIERICKFVDGVPLAIELCASWLRALSCDDIWIELQNDLTLLKSSAPDLPERHRSMQAVFNRAWKLLPSSEKQVLRRLSVLHGEFSLYTARVVAGSSITSLSNLIAHSFIQKSSSGTYCIHRLLRRYAQKKLQSNREHGKESTIAIAMLSLMRGEFEIVSQIADELLSESLDDLNSDKGFGLCLLGIMAGARGNYHDCLQLCQSSLPLVQNEPIALLFAYLGLSIGLCGNSDYIHAEKTLRLAIAETKKLGAEALTSLCMPIIAVVCSHLNDSELAMKAMGAIEEKSASLPAWLLEWQLYAQLNHSLKEKLTKDVIDDLKTKGATTSMSDIIADFY